VHLLAENAPVASQGANTTIAGPVLDVDEQQAQVVRFRMLLTCCMDFMGPQKNTEEALLTATRPPAGRAARPTRVTRPAS
jgi:hypothetical protein